MKKQLRGLFCAAALAAVLALPALAAEQTHRAYLCGYPDGSIQPGAPVTRAQLVFIFYPKNLRHYITGA